MSTWISWNPNPEMRHVGDCAVRAIAAALDVEWEQAYAMLCAKGYSMSDLPNADAVWGAVLKQHGFKKAVVPDTCPDCYTASDFANDHPKGTYVLGFGGHVATLRNGRLLDAWDSSNEIPQFYWTRED